MIRKARSQFGGDQLIYGVVEIGHQRTVGLAAGMGFVRRFQHQVRSQRGDLQRGVEIGGEVHRVRHFVSVSPAGSKATKPSTQRASRSRICSIRATLGGAMSVSGVCRPTNRPRLTSTMIPCTG